MPTGDDDDGSVWATTLPPHYVGLSAVARGNASLAASLIAAPPNIRGRIIATGERLADLEEPVLTALADHPLPDLIDELALPMRNPDFVATWARGELDARRRREETTKWTWDRIGGWIVALIIAVIAFLK